MASRARLAREPGRRGAAGLAFPAQPSQLGLGGSRAFFGGVCALFGGFGSFALGACACGLGLHGSREQLVPPSTGRETHSSARAFADDAKVTAEDLRPNAIGVLWPIGSAGAPAPTTEALAFLTRVQGIAPLKRVGVPPASA